MNQNKLSVREGETLLLLWENDEEGANTATITISEDSVGVLTKTVTFDGLNADLSLTPEETLTLGVGEFEYMITLIYDDDTVEKYPDVSGCSECTLPTLEVCLANDVEGS